jgi:hypothetical protein
MAKRKSYRRKWGGTELAGRTRSKGQDKAAYSEYLKDLYSKRSAKMVSDCMARCQKLSYKAKKRKYVSKAERAKRAAARALASMGG